MITMMNKMLDKWKGKQKEIEIENLIEVTGFQECFRISEVKYLKVIMSDSEEEKQIQESVKVAEKIKTLKRNPETSGMFVSGWDDADQDVEVVENPQDDPKDYVLWAAEHGELEILKELITKEPSLVHTADKDGYTALHRAAYSNHITVISYLLSAGASVHAKTLVGWTPLHSACNWNNYVAVARLLAAGSNPGAVSDGEQTPMHLAAAISHCKSTLLLLLLREDVVEISKRRNRGKETAEQLAHSHGIYSPLFDMVLPAACHIRSLSFTCNPYIRSEKI